VTASGAKTKTGTVTGVDQTCYFVSDPPRAIAFYRDVLGMTPTAVDDEGRGAEFILADGTAFAVWKDTDTPTSGGIVMLAVEAINTAIAQFRERGATLSEVTESPICYMSFGKDPDGNAFIIHQRKTND
jgi:predicted enzyme related to lactoylglutathione lyase